MKNVKLSPPWNEYVNKIKALFEKDSDIKISYDQDAIELSLLVDNTDKATALAYLLPYELDLAVSF